MFSASDQRGTHNACGKVSNQPRSRPPFCGVEATGICLGVTFLIGKSPAADANPLRADRRTRKDSSRLVAGRSPPRTIDHQELVFKEEIFGEDRLDAARSQQRSQCGHQMREQREQVSHHRETLREALPSDKTAKCIH